MLQLDQNLPTAPAGTRPASVGARSTGVPTSPMRTEFCYVEDIYTPSAFYGCYFSKCRQLRPSTKPLLAWFWNLPVILIAISANAKNPCQAREYIVFPSPSNSGNACVRFHENPEGWPTFGVYRIFRNGRWLRLVYMHKPKEATNTLSHLNNL